MPRGMNVASQSSALKNILNNEKYRTARHECRVTSRATRVATRRLHQRKINRLDLKKSQNFFREQEFLLCQNCLDTVTAGIYNAIFLKALSQICA